MSEMKFKEWFNTCLTVGKYPMVQSGDDISNYKEYDVFVNVSDEWYPDIDNQLRFECTANTHWFPMGERGHDNGINSIYGACYILHLAELAGLRVYLHCHAGKHRSRVIQAAYHFMRSNSHYDGYEYNGFDTPLHYDCSEGDLPPLKEMESFLGRMSKAVKRIPGRFVGGSLDDSKIGYVKAYKLKKP